MNYLENSTQVVLLKVPSEANAYRMFETLNDRGLRTTQADLVKNHLFGEAGEAVEVKKSIVAPPREPSARRLGPEWFLKKQTIA